MGVGLLRGLKAKNDDVMQQVIAKAFENGVLVIKSAQSTVRFLPLLTISEEGDRGGVCEI